MQTSPFRPFLSFIEECYAYFNITYVKYVKAKDSLSPKWGTAGRRLIFSYVISIINLIKRPCGKMDGWSNTKAFGYLNDLFLDLYSDGKQCIVFLNALIKADWLRKPTE